MIKEHLNTVISILIVLIFGILSIEFQNMVGAFSYIYMPICLFILLKNLNNENFTTATEGRCFEVKWKNNSLRFLIELDRQVIEKK